MKFQASNVEYWRQANQSDTVFFGNQEKGFALVISNIPGTKNHYLEWNDQSNACVNGVEKIQLAGAQLHIRLLPEAADKLGETEFLVDFECDETIYSEVTSCLKQIFSEKLIFTLTALKQKEILKKDYSNIHYLNLEGKNLTKLPEEVAEMINVEAAKLALNPKLDFHAVCEVLATFPNLKELSFSLEGGSITESLGKLIHLETLSITNLTQPCSFPESMGQLTKLKSLLVMSSSSIVLPESFGELKELEQLNLRVESWPLPTRFYQLSKLKQLDFSNCRFTHLPPEMTQMTEVNTIMFSSQMEHDFSQIMPIVAQMPKLKVLEMSINPVPTAIGLCKNIEELIILPGVDSDKPLQLPDEFFELTQLKTLLMTFHYFEKIPNGIGKLKNLKTLSLQESVFESLPDTIGDLSNLEFLNLSENPSLHSLPESLGNLTQLKSLYLNDTPKLTALPISLKNLTNLNEVFISNRDQLKNIPESWDSLLTEV